MLNKEFNLNHVFRGKSSLSFIVLLIPTLNWCIFHTTSLSLNAEIVKWILCSLLSPQSGNKRGISPDMAWHPLLSWCWTICERAVIVSA